MSTTFVEQVTLTTMHCGKCGGTYAINEVYRQQKQNEGEFWNCPYCDCRWGYGEGENAKLKKQIAQLQSTVEHKDAAIVEVRGQRDAAMYRARSFKGVCTRVRNRIKHGVCPCCNRTFSNLAAHMTTKHPAYVSDADIEPAKP